MSQIYDGAFRTILNDCRKLILPLINEIFGEESLILINVEKKQTYHW